MDGPAQTTLPVRGFSEPQGLSRTWCPLDFTASFNLMKYLKLQSAFQEETMGLAGVG